MKITLHHYLTGQLSIDYEDKYYPLSDEVWEEAYKKASKVKRGAKGVWTLPQPLTN